MRPALPLLPVTEALPRLAAALENGNRAVLVAPPGAGKTTLVPLALLEAPWRGDGTIVLLEPRRLAARAAARRMAALLGEAVAGTVGYAMRMDRAAGAETRILVVTEGILSRIVLDDPELPGIAAVVFDEFHERSLDGDFGLALALDAQTGLRPNLRILVMSATLDGAAVSRLLHAPVIESAGRSFPVESRYRPRDAAQPVEDAMAAAVRTALGEGEGGVLAFLPGQREIERTRERLEGALPASIDIVALHGGLDARAQDAAIRPAVQGRRKVVLATAIAETSITIEDVRIVIDSGLSRVPRYEPATGLTRLETVRVSRASADQRAGRAGRTAPGVAIRLWRAEQTAGLPAAGTPEILEADLSGLLLDCASYGVADPARLPFLDSPPAPALAEARTLLTTLGALDADGRITAAGEAMRRLSLPVRLAHMVAEAAARGEALAAAQLAILVTERGLGSTSVDLGTRLSRFRREPGTRAEAARSLAARIARQAGRSSGTGDVEAGAMLIDAYPDRVARARGAYGSFVLANGRGASLDAADPLAAASWLVVADLQGQARNARIASAATVEEATVRARLGGRLETVANLNFDAGTGRLRARAQERLGAILLAERQLPVQPGEAAVAALLRGVRDHGLQVLPWTKGAEQLRRRLGWLHASLGAPWPAMDDEALLAGLDDWLAPYLAGATALAGIDIQGALAASIPYELQRRVDVLAPTHFSAPSGSTVPIRYEEGGPVLAIRVQELFGLGAHPTIADGRIALTLELLSPAHRPIQTTRDLPGFWAGSWADVRAEMRGRYPRHPWPDDPRNAAATSRAKPRGT